MERVPVIGDKIAQQLTHELEQFPTVYHNDEEAFMTMVKTVCGRYTLTQNQMRALVRSLNADFYRLITQKQRGLPQMSPSQSAFSSFENLLSALEQSADMLEEVEAGAVPPPDIDALFGFSKEPKDQSVPRPASANAIADFDPLQHAGRMMEMIDRHYARWEEAKIVIRSREVARNLRSEALVCLLEQARLAQAFDESALKVAA